MHDIPVLVIEIIELENQFLEEVIVFKLFLQYQ